MIKCRPTKTMRTFGATFDPNTKYYKIWCHLRLHFYSLLLILYWNPILSWAKMMNGQMSPLPNTIKYGVICVCIFIPFFWSCIGTLFYHGIKWWTFYVLGPLFIVVFFLSLFISFATCNLIRPTHLQIFVILLNVKEKANYFHWIF